MRTLKLVRGKSARHEAIRRLIRTQRISTQEELVDLLTREGFELTQATLSRDLAQLGALRVSRPEGTVYDRLVRASTYRMSFAGRPDLTAPLSLPPEGVTPETFVESLSAMLVRPLESLR